MAKHPDQQTIYLDDASQLPQVYDNLQRSITSVDFTETFESRIAPALAQAHKQYFATETSPSGEAWPQWYFRPLAAGDHKTLHLSGALEESLTERGRGHVEEIQPRQMVWGTSIPYSYQHQEGGQFFVDQPLIGRDGRGYKHAGDTINLPQREHVGLTDDLINTICGMIGDAVIAQISGA